MSTQLESAPSSGLDRRSQTSNNLEPCSFWLKGNCRFGEHCEFSHGAGTNNELNGVDGKPHARTSEDEADRTKTSNETTDAHHDDDSNPTLDPKPENSDNFQLGLSQRKAGISDAITEQQPSTSTSRRGKRRVLAAEAKRAEEKRKRKDTAALAAERAKEEREQRLVREKAARDAQVAAAREFQLQWEVRRKEEALVTEQEVVLGSSLVTYGAGLGILGVITGFDLCRVTIKGLPRNAKQEEIIHIFTQQGIERSNVFIGQLKNNGTCQEATLLMKSEEGRAIAIGLQDIEFHDHLLTFEVSGEAGGNTMARNSDCLTVYWRAPSETFIVTYLSIDEARRKVSELDGRIYKGQRIRAQLEVTPRRPRGSILRYSLESPSSIKLTGFPIGTLPDDDLESFSGSHQIRALISDSTSCELEESHDILLRYLRLCRNVKIETYQDLTPKPVGTHVKVKVQFETWEDAKSAYESINDKQLGHNSPLFRGLLPNPLRYTISIPKQQYKAQKRQWDALSERRPDRDAHVQPRLGSEGDVSIHVLGQDKKAVGSLKVRVERMVAGERLDPEFWHPSFLAPDQRVFFHRIYKTKGVYVKSDPKTRSLKVYGGSDAMIDEVCSMVKEEVDRLVELETTELLEQASVGFFVREGLGELKELLGEENATMSFGSSGCHITIKGGEKGKRQLNRLIAKSQTGVLMDQTLPGDIDRETCPICTDEVSHAERLGCGHTYCSGCLRHYLESALHTKTFPLVCIGDEGACKSPISIPHIRRFLQPQVFQALVEVVFRSYLDQHAQELKFCRTPDCQQIYRHIPNRRIILQCPSCFSTICSACDEEAHEGMTCEEWRIHKDPAEQDRLFDEWAAAHGKRCPECKNVIEKNDGCNHIECHCGAHFCWTCGETFDSNEIYQHMNTAHGGIYDQNPAWANPDNVEANIVEHRAGLLPQPRRPREIWVGGAARLPRQNALHDWQMNGDRRREMQNLNDEDILRRQNIVRRELAAARGRRDDSYWNPRRKRVRLLAVWIASATLILALILILAISASRGKL